MTARYAIFYAPPTGSALARLGAAWLGRDADSGVEVAQPKVPFVEAAQLAQLTAAPRLYAFHATLKPPFRLAAGETLGSLRESVERLAAALLPVTIERLQVRLLSRFLALVPAIPCPELRALADACVRGFDRFRAAPPEEELARRMKKPLSLSQERHLLRWGYPHVMEHFRFHMTLTGEIAPDEAEPLAAFLADYFAAELAAPQVIDALSLFEQPALDEPLHRIAVYPLTGDAAGALAAGLA